MSLVDQDDPTDEIARIEARLEQLAEVAERCRKFILASKAAIAGGGALLLVVVLGLLGANETVALGRSPRSRRIVSLGSNVSTLRQTEADIGKAEAHRSDLIGMIDLQMVGDRTVRSDFELVIARAPCVPSSQVWQIEPRFMTRIGKLP